MDNQESILHSFRVYTKIKQQINDGQGIARITQENKCLNEIEDVLPNENTKIEFNKLKEELQSIGWRDIKYIGKGDQGIVVAAIKNETGKRQAIKALKTKLYGQELKDQVQSAKREIEILKSCSNKNIVKYLGHEEKGDYCLIYLQECKGSLSQILSNSIFLNENSFIKYALQMALGVDYLHDKNVIIKDLKPDNILMTYSDNAVVSDLGLSKVLTGNEYLASVNAGNQFYIAPEVYQNILQSQQQGQNQPVQSQQSQKSDAYALGAIFYQMVEGVNKYLEQIYYNVLNKNYNEIQFFQCDSLEIKDIILSLLKWNPLERSSVKDVAKRLSYLYFTKIDCEYSLSEQQQENIDLFQLNQEVELVSISDKSSIPIFSQKYTNRVIQLQQRIEKSKQDCLNFANNFFSEIQPNLHWPDYDEFIAPQLNKQPYYQFYQLNLLQQEEIEFGIDFMDNIQFWFDPEQNYNNGILIAKENLQTSPQFNQQYSKLNNTIFNKGFQLYDTLQKNRNEILLLQNQLLKYQSVVI